MWKEAARTAGLCLVFYGCAALTVWVLWPYLSALPFLQGMPGWLPGALAGLASLAVLFLITHLERGAVDAQGYPFLIIYGGVCLLFSFSTALPSQFNAGTATVNLAFVYMVVWKLLQKRLGKNG